VNPGLETAHIMPHVPERRRFRRYHYSAPIAIRSSDAAEVRGISMEISEGGISLLATAALKVGDIVELDPVGGETTKAILRRVVGKLYAFEFVGPSPALQKRIRKMCQMLPLFQSHALDLWRQQSLRSAIPPEKSASP